MSQTKTQKLDIQQILNDLFSYLNPREKEVLKRRYGLQGNDQETLEKIGQSYNITRERVRQIEANGLRKLKKVDAIQKVKIDLDYLSDLVQSLLLQAAGLMTEGDLVGQLAGVHKKINEIALKQSVNFLLSYVLQDRFDRINRHDKFQDAWKIKNLDFAVLDKVIDALVKIINDNGQPMSGEELMKTFQKSDFYKSNEKVLLELCDLNHDKKLTLDEVLFSYVKVSQGIKQNLFNQWGLRDWKIVSPKTINDKIYLILKKNEKPMHYREIAAGINEAAFDKKKACAATVHNELIIDKKYVLVGRGYYALREWGYEDGTVEEMIEKILGKAKKPLAKDEIIKQVLDKKFVKQSTIYLALLNKKKFKKVEQNKYSLK
ncbi:MAG TPA: sigma factor-like helix-turn-helix DNA-binding protein [bacterium]|nr:sigma factor-like helix-turn-helix DNA-binding protein [bacterium]